MEGSIVSTNVLDIVDLQLAHDQYDNFVDIHRPILSISEFKEQRNLPLNEKYTSVFYTKTAHLKDCDFIEIDRSILKTIGFKNTFYEKKDRNANIKIDKNGETMLQDMRADFNNAIRCLRNTVGFVEGKCFDDKNCHFVIQKNVNPKRFTNSSYTGAGGQNKQSIWIRMRALEHFIIMANTQNSFMIREYFIDMKRIMSEYNMYQKVYASMYEMSIKDTSIKHLNEMVLSLHEKSDFQTKQNRELLLKNDNLLEISQIQCQKLDMLSQILYKESNDKVLPVKEKAKTQELVVLQKRSDPSYCEVLRGQMNHINNQLKRKHEDMEVVGKISTYKNPINLYNHFGDYLKENREEFFKKSNNKIILNNGSTASDLMQTIRALEEEKHSVAENVKQHV